MYFRVKRTGSHAYLQILESFRERGQVHQRVLSTVGRLDTLHASGQLDTLMRSGLRFCEKLAVIDVDAAGQTEPVQEQRVGPDLVFSRLWEALELGTILKHALELRRHEFDVERAVYLTVVHCLFASGGDRAAERWRQAYRLSDTLELHHLYRSLSWVSRSKTTPALGFRKRRAAPKIGLRRNSLSNGGIYSARLIWSSLTPRPSISKARAARRLAGTARAKMIGRISGRW